RLARPRHRPDSRAYHFENAIRTKHFEQTVDLIFSPCDFNGQRVWSNIDHARAEYASQLEYVRACLMSCSYFDHRQVADDRGLVGYLFDQQDVGEFVEVGFDAASLVSIG